MKKILLLCLCAAPYAVAARNSNAALNSVYAHGHPMNGLRHLLGLAPLPAPVPGEEPPTTETSVTLTTTTTESSFVAVPPTSAPAVSSETSTSSAMPAAMSEEHKILASINDTVTRLHHVLGQTNTTTTTTTTSEEDAINAFVNKTASVVHAMAEVAEAAVEEVALRAASKILKHIESTQNVSSVTVVEAVITQGLDSDSTSSAQVFELKHNVTNAPPGGENVVVGEVVVVKSDEVPFTESEIRFEEEVASEVEDVMEKLVERSSG